MTSSTRVDEVKKKIEFWLKSDQYKVTEDTTDQARFRLKIEDPDGWKFYLVQPNDADESIGVIGFVILSQQEKNKIGGMEAEARADFLWELRFGLLESGVESSPIDESVEKIGITTLLYYDGLTRDGLMQRISLVRRMMIWTGWKIQKQFKARSPSVPRQMYG